ncbi:MAG: SCO family protein [Jatrophihabitantaceae bacterium]
MKLRLAAASLVLVLAGCSSAGSGSTPAGTKSSELNDQTGSGKYAGVGLIPPRPRPQFTLGDTTGKSYAFGQRTQGKATLLYFGYTRCPDVCPATMSDIGVALRRLPVAIQKQVIVVFVSTDVKHDTARVLRTWLAHFTPDTHATFVGLRGTQAQLDAAQAAAHIMLAADGGQTHSSQVLLYGPDDYAHVSFVYSNAGEQRQLAHDLPIVVNS